MSQNALDVVKKYCVIPVTQICKVKKTNRFVFGKSRLISGFSERSLSPTTIRGFFRKVKLFIDKLLLIEELKETCFDLAEDGSFKYHTGAAADLRKLKLPLPSKAVEAVFMLVSKDARRKRKISALEPVVGTVNDVAHPSTSVVAVQQSFCT